MWQPDRPGTLRYETQGADREIEWEELPRFEGLPLLTTFREEKEGEEAVVRTGVMEVEELDVDGERVVLRMADSMGNSPGALRTHWRRRCWRWILSRMAASIAVHRRRRNHQAS